MAYSQAHRLPLPAEASTSSLTGPDSLSLKVDQALLNPRFEAYKLVQDDPSCSSIRSHTLPSRPPRLTDLYRSHHAKRDGNLTFSGLGYKETKERALHQVLVPTAGTREGDDPFAAYVDANGFVVALTFDAGKDRLVGHPVYRLEATGEAIPSLASVSTTEWLVCGGGDVVLIRLQKVSSGNEAAGAVRWISGAETRSTVDEGYTIKGCKRVGSKIRALLQRSRKAEGGAGREDMQGLGYPKGAQSAERSNTEPKSGSGTTFEVQLVELDGVESAAVELQEGGHETQTATVLWSAQGEEPLIMAKVDEQQVLLGAEASFRTNSGRSTAAAELKEPSRSGTSKAATEPPPAIPSRRPAPHYSWAQTSDTITLAFAIPGWISTSHIRAHFSLSALSLSLTQEALALLDAPTSTSRLVEIDAETGSAAVAQDDDLTRSARMIASGRYVSRSTWGEIDPTGSVWTLERAKGVSMLTLHLEKKHGGTRWVQVFADRSGSRKRKPSQMQSSFQQARSTFQQAIAGTTVDENGDAGGSDDGEDNEDDVPETMDPSELLGMLEGMEKYTVDEDSTAGFGMDRTGLTNSSGTGSNGGTSLSLDQPSLLKDNLEEEDANVGRPFVLTCISTSNGTHISNAKESSTILATPLPSSDENHSASVVKHDLDGAIFTPSSTGSWIHTSTMPALSFVLASKRDAQRVHIFRRRHRSGYVVLAFESAPQVTGGEGGGGAGNLFLYYSAEDGTAKNAPSRVVRLADGKGREEEEEGLCGALLGVCAVKLPCSGKEGWEDVLVCLCEQRVLLLRGVL
ncbi:CS domain-containing protein [Pseudozyma hubeiensis]|nr:CS domain-containing protein [Pseudozyma hubeiensis]